jgi:hypothetical protein
MPTLAILTGEAMSAQKAQIVGNWVKTTRSTCDRTYPDLIQFQEGGLYFGQQEATGTFTQWDVGTYKFVDSQQISISTANDATIVYNFSILNDVLTFIDPGGCEFKYRSNMA